MKKKIGEIYNKPIVVGNKNEINKNEIHVDELVASGENNSKELERNDVNFFDYDGTLLYAYTWDEVKNLAELPAAPSHAGMTFKEWNYTLEDIKEQGTDTIKGKADVGAVFVAGDGNVIDNPKGVFILPRNAEWHEPMVGIVNVYSLPNTLEVIPYNKPVRNCIFPYEVKVPTNLLLNDEYYRGYARCSFSSIWINGMRPLENMFEHCAFNSPIIIPETIKEIGSCFYNSAWSYIKIPRSVERIKGGAFSISVESGFECFNDYIVDFSEHTSIPIIDADSFNNSNAVNVTTSYLIVIPDELYNEWTSFTNWGSYPSSWFVKASEFSSYDTNASI